MKVGDLVTLRWGEHPRQVGTIIKLGPHPPDVNMEILFPVRKVLWFGIETGNATSWISGTDLEKVND
jgi:hypothetical protein